MRSIILIAHDIRSTHNVGSLLRTAECLGIDHVYLTGYTPYPVTESDERLPHIAAKLTAQIRKTALDAETLVPWSQSNDVLPVLDTLRQNGYQIMALEQTKNSSTLPDFSPPEKLAIVLGREVEGIATELLEQCDVAVEIPQFGQKESLNVVQAAAMALYHCRFSPQHILRHR